MRVNNRTGQTGECDSRGGGMKHQNNGGCVAKEGGWGVASLVCGIFGLRYLAPSLAAPLVCGIVAFVARIQFVA